MKCKICEDTGSRDKNGVHMDCTNCDIAEFLKKEYMLCKQWEAWFQTINGHPDNWDAWLEAKRQSKLEIDDLKEKISKLESTISKYDEFILQQLGN